MLRFFFDLFFVVAISLVAAYGLATVLRGRVSWWQVLIVGVVVWILGTATWWGIRKFRG